MIKKLEYVSKYVFWERGVAHLLWENTIPEYQKLEHDEQLFMGNLVGSKVEGKGKVIV